MNAHSIPIRAHVETDEERAEAAREEAHEAAREWALEQFHDWQREGIRGLRECDNNPRDDADFADWLHRMAQPHMRDHERYAAALRWDERDAFERAALLMDLARGQRMFVRNGGGA